MRQMIFLSFMFLIVTAASTSNITTSGGKSHTYAYTYDGLNRLTAAKNHAGASIVLLGNDAVSYNEEFTYDKHGNIITLQRNTQGKKNVVSMYDPETGQISPVIISYSAVPFDRLSMDYDGNRLVSVTDEVEEAALYNRKEYHDWNTDGHDFAYDANGNLIYDLDRDIVTVRYNLLNLPDTVQFRDGRQILNKYAADGTRLASTYYTPTSITVNPLSVDEVINLSTYPPYLLDRVRTWFVDNKEYGLMYPEHYDYLELKRIYTPEGYVDEDGNYYYYRRDHLGNVREVWKATDAGAQTVQRTRYYPSGLPWEYQPGDSASLQPYKYGGKEFVETHGLDMYDSHARWYDPRIMRPTTMDPLAEEYYNVSPYVWCGNNPVRNVDPMGMDYWSTNDQDEIKRFLEAVESKESFFNFYDWSHASNRNFLSKLEQGELTYNDEKGVYYQTQGKMVGGEFTIVSQSKPADIQPSFNENFGYDGIPIYEPLSGFWQHAAYYVLGWHATYSTPILNYSINPQGRISGVEPLTVTPPLPGMKGGKLVQKMGKAKGNMTGNRFAQQKQFDAVVKELRLNKDQARQLHDVIHNQGYGYQEILQEAKYLFNK